jgi:hypothetical protein
MADPSGPVSATDDTATAILRPKRSLVAYAAFAHLYSHLLSPNRLIVDEATSDDNSGRSFSTTSRLSSQ